MNAVRLAAAVLAALPAFASEAQTPRSVKFTLDWALQGNHSIWAIALERGLFAAEGLTVAMDRGFGSGDAVTKVASGAYDFGFADLNAVIKFNGENPATPVIAVYQVFDTTLNAIVALRKSGIASPKDLEGRKLGAPETDSSRLMFPPFARANGIDEAKIAWTSMAPNLRETMLVQGQVDAISGFVSTTLFNLKALGVTAQDMVIFPFSEHGLDVYGSAVIVRKDFAEKAPEAVKAFVRATIAGTRAVLADRDAALAALKKIDPLVNVDLEKERLQLCLDRTMLTARIRAQGFGAVDSQRMARSIAVAAEAYRLKAVPAPENVYSTAFLPPAEARMP